MDDLTRDGARTEESIAAERANRVREEVGISFATSWNRGGPECADSLIKERRSTSSTSAARCFRTRFGLSDLSVSSGTTPPSDSFRKTGNGGFATRALTPRQ